MKCKNIIDILEELAPQKFAENWDNCGLSYGNKDIDVNRILVALEPTENVIGQGIEKDVDMIITHHPMIFSSVKTLSFEKVIGRKITKLAKNDIVCYSMHTNMDAVVMARVAAEKMGLEEVIRLDVTDEHSYCVAGENITVGIGSIGNVTKSITLRECSELVKDIFNIDRVRVVGDLQKRLNRIAILPGSGKSYIKKAIKEKVDVLITGDIDYHSAVDALEEGICLIDAGHYDTEHFFVEYIAEYLNNKLIDFGVKVDIATEESPFTII